MTGSCLLAEGVSAFSASEAIPNVLESLAESTHYASVKRWRDKAEIIIAKHRHAATGKATLGFDAPCSRFFDGPDADP